MAWVKDIIKRIDWVEVAYKVGPRLGLLIALIFGITPVAKTVIVLLSLNVPNFAWPSDFGITALISAVWLAVAIVSLLFMAGQFLNWKDEFVSTKKQQAKAVFHTITGREWPDV